MPQSTKPVSTNFDSALLARPYVSSKSTACSCCGSQSDFLATIQLPTDWDNEEIADLCPRCLEYTVQELLESVHLVAEGQEPHNHHICTFQGYGHRADKNLVVELDDVDTDSFNQLYFERQFEQMPANIREIA